VTMLDLESPSYKLLRTFSNPKAPQSICGFGINQEDAIGVLPAKIRDLKG
jgi:hypothetical protein